MGQYHKVVNLDKREYIHPHELGAGLKLWEQLAAHPGTGAALLALLACSNGRGGGDLKENPIIGRWAGDRIAVVGDYAEDTDLPAQFKASEIYGACGDEGEGAYKNITPDIAALIESELEGKFEGDGWKAWTAPGEEPTHGAMRPDMILSVPRS